MGMLDIKSLCLLCCLGQLVIKSGKQLEIEPVGGTVCGKGDRKSCGAQRHHRLKIGCAPQTQIGTLTLWTSGFQIWMISIKKYRVFFSESKSKLHQVHKSVNEIIFVLQGLICSHVKSL